MSSQAARNGAFRCLEESLLPGIDAQHPDTFVRHLVDLDPELVCEALHDVQERLKNPSKSVDEVLDTLAEQGLEESVKALRQSPYVW